MDKSKQAALCCSLLIFFDKGELLKEGGLYA